MSNNILTGYFVVTGKRENIADKTKKYFRKAVLLKFLVKMNLK